MDSQTSIISTKGQLVIPAEMRARLGLHPGDRIALTLDDSRIILQPVNEQFVDGLRGIFARQTPSMADELQQERRQEKW